MILSDREIQAALATNAISIFDPPDKEMYDSTAVDLTLDKRVLVWRPLVYADWLEERLPAGASVSAAGACFAAMVW
jgi:hypothetical protein